MLALLALLYHYTTLSSYYTLIILQYESLKLGSTCLACSRKLFAQVFLVKYFPCSLTAHFAGSLSAAPGLCLKNLCSLRILNTVLILPILHLMLYNPISSHGLQTKVYIFMLYVQVFHQRASPIESRCPGKICEQSIKQDKTINSIYITNQKACTIGVYSSTFRNICYHIKQLIRDTNNCIKISKVFNRIQRISYNTKYINLNPALQRWDVARHIAPGGQLISLLSQGIVDYACYRSTRPLYNKIWYDCG